MEECYVTKYTEDPKVDKESKQFIVKVTDFEVEGKERSPGG